MRIHRVANLDAPDLRPYRTLRRPAEQYDQGLFVAEGKRVVYRLFESTLAVRSILLTDEWLERKRGDIEALSSSPDVFVGSKEMLQDIVGFNLHQGIMAVAEIPAERPIDDVTGNQKKPCLLLAIDNLLNSENVGVIVRNARAFGVDGIFVGETSSSPYLRRAVRSSLGAVFSVPILHPEDLASTLRMLSSEHDVTAVAAESRTRGVPVDSVDLTGRVCIVVGGEDNGIREDVLKACSTVVEIPMTAGFDSINVANATAVCLYEAHRQRRKPARS